MQEFIHLYKAGILPQTLLLLHGTGGDETQLMELGVQVLPGANLLGVRGRVSENGVNRFFRRFEEGVFDREDLIFRTGELAGFVKSAANRYGFDPMQVYALGYSNGANIGAALLLLHPETLAGGALLHAQIPLTPDVLSDLSGKRILITAGKRDAIVSPAQAEGLRKMLQERHAEVELWQHEGGHEISTSELEKVGEWLGSL
ncbi:MAG: alpha/beta hydrolase [Chthonomonadaceae bacterium]|nr:alpha/beta hydrolase [Chthonomonadaceae bacterium]